MDEKDHGNRESLRTLERRLARIDRWLKRCLAACRHGSWSSAVMEVECMEAETRQLRDELWRAAAEEAEGRKLRSRFSLLANARVAVLALVIVLAAGLPLSLEQDLPFSRFAPESLVILTSTESDILDALRETLSSGNKGRVVVQIDVPEGGAQDTPQAGAAVASTEPPKTARPVVTIRREPQTAIREPEVPALRDEVQAAKPSVEEVISLIQVGERALRGLEPAVRVVD